MTSTPHNIVRNGEASRSALRVASQRAVHQLLDEPIVLPDPIALPILGAQMEADLRNDPYALNDPMSRALRAFLVVRSRVAEDELQRAVAAGVRQYVLLGAGLDTFAYRNPHPGTTLQVFEADHPSTQQWKRQLLEDAGIARPDGLRFVPVDFEIDTLAAALADAGFQPDRPACFAWLGVTMYLTDTAIMDTLSFIAGLPRHSSVVFDYRVTESLLNPVERAVGQHLIQRMMAVGEPWVSAFDPAHLSRELQRLGFSEVDDSDGEQLNARYLARRKDGLHVGSLSRVLCARV